MTLFRKHVFRITARSSGSASALRSSSAAQDFAPGSRRRRFGLAPLSAALLILHAAGPAWSDELGAHEHGAANLDVLLDGAMLYIDLDTPAANVLGFEHAPSTDEQRDAVQSARASLESGELFVPDAAAGCSLESADVQIGLAEDAEHDGDHHDEDHHGEDDHDDDHHDDEHEDEHGDDRDGEHHDEAHAEGEEHAGETHSDITAAYVYRCDEPAALNQVATMLFETFEGGFEDVDVQLVGPGGQSATELAPDRTTIEFDAVR